MGRDKWAKLSEPMGPSREVPEPSTHTLSPHTPLKLSKPFPYNTDHDSHSLIQAIPTFPLRKRM